MGIPLWRVPNAKAKSGMGDLNATDNGSDNRLSVGFLHSKTGAEPSVLQVGLKKIQVPDVNDMDSGAPGGKWLKWPLKNKFQGRKLRNDNS